MKTKKPRTGKKRNHLKALQPALNNVVLYSGHCWENMQIIGIKNRSIHEAIFSQNHKFNIMLLVFCSDGVKNWVDTFIPDIPPCKSGEAQSIADPISDSMISKINPKYFLSSGWYCVLTDRIDLKAMEGDIIKLFADAGAFNREVCNLAWSLRPDSEK